MSEAEEQAQEQQAEEPAPQEEGLDQAAQNDVKALIAKYDKSGNGKLEFDEFLGFMEEGLGITKTDGFLKQMRFIFDGMDTDGSHNLDSNEIITCLGKLKDKDFKYITRMIFRGADVDKSRKVSISELKQACETIGDKTFSQEQFEQQCENEFGKKKKELEYWEFYKLISGETLSKDSPDYDPYEGKLETKSKCCILI